MTTLSLNEPGEAVELHEVVDLSLRSRKEVGGRGAVLRRSLKSTNIGVVSWFQTEGERGWEGI